MRLAGVIALGLTLGAGPALADGASGGASLVPVDQFHVVPFLPENGFGAYSHAIAALALWGLLMQVLALWSTRGRTPENRTESGLPKRNYAEPSYRAHRAFANAIESTGPFIAGTVAAILAGAAPFWVNLFASVFIVARLAMAYVHIATENQNARSACYVLSWACMIALGIMGLVAAVTG